MQITVFGASGRIGQRVVHLALQQGHTVRAFVHSHDPFSAHDGLEIIKGDISELKPVARALEGSEAVISALGSWGTKQKNTLTVGMETIIPLMQERGAHRLITLTGSGALWSGDKPGFSGRSAHMFLGLIAPKILKDGEQHLKLLEASSLNWTCLRAPAMNNRGSVSYHLNTRLSSLFASVSRQSVAQCLLDLVTNGEYLRQAPVIHRS